MKKLIFILFLFPFILLSQTLRDSIEWNNPYYKIIYSEVLEQPRYAYYRVVCPTSTTSRAGLDFTLESGIITSDNYDYINNEWDKGHLAPVGSLRCDRDMVASTFSYVNCALQHYKLNRGIWKTLEIREQYLATQYPEVYVIIQVDFAREPKRVSTNAAIPLGFYKEIKFGNKKECYYFYNTTPKFTELEQYKCKCRD